MDWRLRVPRAHRERSQRRAAQVGEVKGWAVNGLGQRQGPSAGRLRCVPISLPPWRCSFCGDWLAVQARAHNTSLQPAAGPASSLRVAEAKVRPKDGIALPGQAEQSLSRPTADNTRPDRAANGRMGRGRGTRKFKEQGVTGDLLTWGSALFLEHAGP